jgi:hypothetical protein
MLFSTVDYRLDLKFNKSLEKLFFEFNIDLNLNFLKQTLKASKTFPDVCLREQYGT